MNWDRIVEEHGPLVWRTAYRLLGNEADAADAYQEAFAAALEVERRERVLNWGGMLRRLATVKGIEKLRRRKTERARAGLNDLDGVPAISVGPSQAAQDTELLEWLRQALLALPQLQAEVFWLVCVEQ